MDFAILVLGRECWSESNDSPLEILATLSL
jgi:hypothetical protein